MVTSLYFIRHGQIDGNVERRWYGSTDQALNAEGRRQAERLADYLEVTGMAWDHLYCSPLSRTRATADAVSKKLGIAPVEHHGLVEFSIGVLETASFDDLLDKHRLFDQISADHGFSLEGGESVLGVSARMVATINELRDKHYGQNIGIVSHGAAIGIALAQLLENKPFPFHDYHMDNTAMTKLRLKDDEAEIEFFNRADHLHS
jgi:broad specificity phosphatase PhoE